MRLMNTHTRAFEEFIGRNIPKYAILSHTWESEEVSYTDYVEGRYLSMKGYEKIDVTCQLAVRDGLGYAWVDTCCIDKRSSAELTEAINSMFRWYEKAEVCYAFLSDLPPEAAEEGRDLKDCRWFTRGWTLQELIAPHNVTFFNSAWEYIGSKTTLSTHLESITGIMGNVLAKEWPLSQVWVSEKMRWASSRVTTRVEDTAYCLLGLFDVNMPLLYGEEDKAFQRLQEEIIKSTPDLSIFGWTIPLRGRPDDSQIYCSVLARSPKYFSGCAHTYGPRSAKLDFSISHHGIAFSLALYMKSEAARKGFCYILGVFPDHDPKMPGGVLLRKVGDNRFLRIDPWRLYKYDQYTHNSYGTKYLLTKLNAAVWGFQKSLPTTSEWITDDQLASLRGHSLRIKLPQNMHVEEAWPKANFDDDHQLWFVTDVTENSDYAWGMLHLKLDLDPRREYRMGLSTKLEYLFFTNFWTSTLVEDEAFDCSLVPLTTHVAQFEDVKSVIAVPGCGNIRFSHAMDKNGIIPPTSPTIIDVAGTSDVMVVTFETRRILTRIREQKCFVVEFFTQLCPRENAPVVERVEKWRQRIKVDKSVIDDVH